MMPSHTSLSKQILSTDPHATGQPTRHHVLYPGSSGKLIEDAIVQTLAALWESESLEPEDFPLVELEHPADPSHGDWATNVALKLAKPLRQAPRQIADKIAENLQQSLSSIVSKVEVAGPGFINFYLSQEYLLTALGTVLEQAASFGQTAIRADKRLMIEHTQPNSHKEMHVGHLRNSVLGMAEVRLHRAIGYDIISTTYGGDVGPHVAKCLYGLKDTDLAQLTDPDAQVRAIGDAYVRGNQAESEDPTAAQEIRRINKAIYEGTDAALLERWKTTFEWSVARQKAIYQRIGSTFVRYYWESEVWQKGIVEVKKHLGSVFEESDGAVIFDGEKFGLHKRVFITSQGTPTYEAKEIGLEKLKTEEFDFDYCIVQTGNDQADYFKVVIVAFEQVFPDLKGIFENQTFGMVTVPSGKMSSREGNVVRCEEVLDEMEQRAWQEVDNRYPDLDASNKQTLAREISLSATKYALLKYDPKQNIVFNPEETLSFSGDSGPYLQYVCVRIGSILDKARQDEALASFVDEKPDLENLVAWREQLTSEETLLLRKLLLLPEVVIRAALEYKPNYLTTYLFELAQLFNDFYNAAPVLKADPGIARGRLALARATRQVLANGLFLLGIAVPERM